MISEPPENAKAKGVGAVMADAGMIAIPKMDKAEALAKTTHRGREMELVEVPDGVSNTEFRDVLSAAYMAYVGGADGYGTGAPPTLNEVMEYLGDRYGQNRVALIMGTKQFRLACEARGIAMQQRPGLTQQQDLALSIILDPSQGKSLSQRLKKAKVSRAKYEAWKKNPVFRAHIEAIGNSVLKNAETDMLVTLRGLAEDGDLGAIKYAFEVSGKYNPNQQQVMNVQELMVQFITIIQKHVTDQDQLAAIATDFKMLAAASGAGTPEQPRTIQAREKNPFKAIEPEVETPY